MITANQLSLNLINILFKDNAERQQLSDMYIDDIVFVVQKFKKAFSHYKPNKECSLFKICLINSVRFSMIRL